MRGINHLPLGGKHRTLLSVAKKHHDDENARQAAAEAEAAMREAEEARQAHERARAARASLTIERAVTTLDALMCSDDED